MIQFILLSLPGQAAHRRKYARWMKACFGLLIVILPQLAAAQSTSADDFVQYRMAGTAIASQYGRWSISVTSPVTSIGTPVQIETAASSFTIPGGPTLPAFQVGRPLLAVDPDGRTETIIPSAVKCASTANTCSITASFANLHSGLFYLKSASGGLQEAVDDESARGGGIVRITPGWTGTPAEIQAVTLPANVLVLDERAGREVWYSQGGSVPSADLIIAPGLLSTPHIASANIGEVFYADQFPGVDGGAKINACLKAIPASGGVCDARGLSPSGAAVAASEDMFAGVTAPFTLLLGGYTLNVTVPQTITVRAVIVGEGPQSIVYFSAPSGTAFTFAYPDGTGLAYWVQAGMRDLYLAGAGNQNSTVGVQVGPTQGMSTGAAGFAIDHVTVRQFGTNVQLGNNAYSIRFAHVFFEDATTGVLVPAGLQNSGEQISFSASFIADSVTGIDVENDGTEILASNTSFDYNSGPAFKMSTTSYATFSGCHFENRTQQPFVVASAGSTTITGGYFLSNVPAPSPISSAIRTSNVVTVTTVRPHSLSAGQTVSVSGLSDPSMNGTFVISSVPGSTAFTYAAIGSDGSATGGLATLDWPDYVQASGSANMSVVGTQVDSWGSRLEHFVDFSGSGSLDLLGIQTVPIAGPAGSGVVALSGAPSGTPGIVEDQARSLLQNDESSNVFSGSLVVGGGQSIAPSLVAVQAPAQTTDLLDARSSSGINRFSVNAAGTTRVASEGLGTATSRNGITFSTNGSRTEMQWQDFGNSNGPYFAVDPGTDSRSLLFGTNGRDQWSIDSSGNWVPARDNGVNIGSASGARPANIYAAGNIVTPTITVGNDAPFSSAPRMTFSAFIPGNLDQQRTVETWTPDRSIVVTRLEAQAPQDPAGCSSNAAIQIATGSPLVTVSIPSSYADSGPLNVVLPAGTAFHIQVTAAAGCSTWPHDMNVLVQYRMN